MKIEEEKTEDWEKEFDERWNLWQGTTEQRGAIKQFIHDLLLNPKQK